MKIPRQKTAEAEVSLFICCYMNSSHIGDPPHMWALMRTGMIMTDGNEGALGIHRSGTLYPTYSQFREHLNPERKKDFVTLLGDQHAGIWGDVRKTIGAAKLPFIQKYDDRPSRLLGAVLLHRNRLKNLVFRNEDGFGVFLQSKDLDVLLKKAQRVPKIKVISIQALARYLNRINQGPLPDRSKLNFNLRANPDDIKFVQGAFKTWQVHFEEERDRHVARRKKVIVYD